MRNVCENASRGGAEMLRCSKRPGSTTRPSTCTPNLPTHIVDFGGFDSSIMLILRGGIPRPIGDFPESLSRAMLVGTTSVGIMSVGRSGARLRGTPGRGGLSHDIADLQFDVEIRIRNTLRALVPCIGCSFRRGTKDPQYVAGFFHRR